VEDHPDSVPKLKLFPQKDPVYKTGAKLLGRIVYPKPEDSARRIMLEDALCYWALHYDARNDPEDRSQVSVSRAYFGFTQAQLDQHLKFAGKRLEERLMAGRIAAAYLRYFEEGRIPIVLGNIKRMSLNQIVGFVASSEGYTGTGNFEQRFWRPSKPVIHIAAALAVVGQEWKRRGEVLGLLHLLLNQEHVIDVINRAILFADMIKRDTKFPVDPKCLVTIELQ
jgi:hypothetical protein